MRITQLRSFDAVASTGGFSAAARDLGVRQPTVSEQVAALEAEYGVTLIERRAASIALTPLGERLHEVSRRLFELEGRARGILESAQRLDGVQLRISADAPVHAIPLIAAVREQYPAVAVRLGSDNAERLVARLRSGLDDVIIAAGVADDDDLASRVVDRQTLTAVVRTDHAFAGQKTVRLTRLLKERLILRESGSASRAALESAANGTELRTALEADSREGALAAATAGLGVAVIAENEMIDDPRLVMLDIKDPAIVLEERLVCRRAERDTVLCRALFDAVRA
ncbi:LysR substrate-binding domain-containing protein [Humibacter ginsenosidimutans]|uniref:LysR family transcriptional regulator n=1 Tax=Humibacter ginsenosidimutans TaxID=2599293 RepID=A0A5B8M0Q2_9MICO|nr:LysR substrate-binding domain-containing protein [Humibacter ginsenosidimutans]QDZ13611.1 LysR family transcriptional regulator [Humibacter ginsenosidimutans]